MIRSGSRCSSFVSRLLLASLIVTLIPIGSFTLQPEDTQAQPADPPIYVCASLYTGAVRYVTNPTKCSSGEVLVNLNGETPVTLCANPYTGQLRYRFGRPCTSTETSLTLPGEQATTLCVNPYTGQISYRSTGVCPSGTSPIVVPQSNDAPIAQDDAFTVDEDTPLNGNVLADNGGGVDSDPDADPLTVNPTPVSGPTNGALTLNANGDFSYTPDADFNGTDSFVYQLQDGEGGTDTATVTITVNPVNDDPTANPQAVSTDEDEALVITLTGSDVDGDALVFAIATGPANGVLSAITPFDANSAQVTYTPDPDFTGADSFTFTVDDGTVTSAPATVTITVNAVNDPPVAVDDAATVAEDSSATTLDVLANDTDVDGGTNTIQSITQPANGTVVITNAGADLTYQPDANYCNDGTPTDDFTYTLNGGSTATVNVTVTCVDDPPAAVDDIATVSEDAGATAINVLTNDTDVDAGPISITAVTQPANGTVVITGGGSGLTYQPNADYCNNPPGIGFDTFTYTLTPGGSTATVSVTVTCADDNPVAVDDSATLDEDSSATAIAVLANDTDPDGGAMSITSVTQPANGTVIITGGGTGLTYQPDANYCNDGTPTDDFTYTLNGGSTATVSVTVTCVDDLPTAVDDSATVAEDSGANTINVQANDLDLDAGANTIQSVTQPANGMVAITNAGADLTYTPDAEYCNDGSPVDTFSYTLNGGSSATVSVSVTCVDDAPTAVPDTATVIEDSGANAINVLGNDTDPDGGTLLVQSVTQPANGTVAITGGGTGVTYTPNVNYCNNPPGTTLDAFTYTLNGGSAAGVSVTVTCVDDNPTAVADSATVVEDSGANAINVLANDTDPDGGPISIQSITQPANGTAAISGGGTGLTYTPNANYCNNPPGSTLDSFTYTLTPGGSSTTVTVTVTCVDDPPTAVNDAATVVEDSGANAINVLANDTDIDAGPISITSVTQPANGTVAISGGGTGVTYAPNANYCNNPPGTTPDSFTYTLTPGGSTATVNVTVDCVNDPPVAGVDSFQFAGNTELRVDLSAGTTPAALETTGSTNGVLDNDSDPVEGNNITLTSLTVGSCTDNSAPFDCSDPAVGRVQMEITGEFSFTPAPGDTDITETFSYIISDDGAPAPANATGTVTLTRFDRVWYVDPNAGGGGDGTSATPFNTLTPLSGAGGAGDVDVAGDYIFVHDGTLAMTGPLPLEASQYLWGQGVGLSLPISLNGNGNPTNLVPAGALPQLTNATGDTLTIGTAMPTRIEGLSLAGGSGNAIDLTSTAALTGAATLTIANNEFRGAGAEGIDVNLNAGTSGSLFLTIVNNSWVAGTHTGSAVDINRAAGTFRLAFSNNLNMRSNVNAFVLNGGALANATISSFSTNSVHGSTGGAGIVISNVTFDLVPGGAADQVAGGVTVIGASGDPVGGAGMQLSTVTGSLFFDDLDVFAATSGLAVAGAGSMIFGAATGVSTIDADNGPAVDISTTTLNLQLADLESVTTGAGINLSSVSGIFSAPGGSNISKTSGGGTGFVVASSSATVTYGGTLNVTSGAGVSLTGNTGGTINFGGPLTLSTGINAAFAATGGGTVTATNTTSTLTTTTATALNVANTTIGGGGLVFQSINSNGGANPGIVLNNTGSTAGLTVSGTGSAGSGGTIQGKTGDGVSLTSTAFVNLSWMIVQTSGEDGIDGTTVSGFSLANSSVINNGNAANEEGLSFSNLSGIVSLTNVTVTGNAYNNLRIDNTTGTIPSFTITGGSYSNNQAVVGNHGILIEPRGTSQITTATVSNATISGNEVMGIQVATADSATVSAFTVSGNTIQNNELGIDFSKAQTSSLTFSILNNLGMTGQNSHGINVFTAVGAGTTGTLMGRIQGNTIGDADVDGSGSAIGNCIRININGDTDAAVVIDGNTIRECPNGRGIEVIGRNGIGGLDVTVINNNIDHINLTFNPGSSDFPLAAIMVQANCATVCNSVRADIRSNTVPGGSSFDFSTGFITLVESSTSTLELVDSAPASADCAAQLSSTNTGSVGVVGGCALIAGPITVPS